jgi:hypothetical protein
MRKTIRNESLYTRNKFALNWPVHGYRLASVTYPILPRHTIKDACTHLLKQKKQLVYLRSVPSLQNFVTRTTPEDYVFKTTLGLVLSSYYYSISPQRPVGIWPMKTLYSASYKGKVRSHNSKLRWMKYHIAICLGWDTPTKCCIFRTEKWIQLPWWWWCRWGETTYLICIILQVIYEHKKPWWNI